MRPLQPAAMARVSDAARVLPSPPQITGTPRLAAMRASNAIPTTTIISLRPYPQSHAERHRRTVPGLEIAIARKCPERKESTISVIAQIEDPRKARRGIALLIPKAVNTLILSKICYAASNSRMVHLACRHQPEQGPCGLRRGARRALVAAIIEPVARPVLAPAAIRILDRE